MFYKFEEENLLYGTLVCGPTYTLIESEHDSYNYPVDGWYWFDTEEGALEFFNDTNSINT